MYCHEKQRNVIHHNTTRISFTTSDTDMETPVSDLNCGTILLHVVLVVCRKKNESPKEKVLVEKPTRNCQGSLGCA